MSSTTASKLNSLIGLAEAKRLVAKIAAEPNGVHAVLFYGLEGSGKEELALALAEAWLCKSPTADGADGVCQACGAFSRRTNPDFLSVSPTGAGSVILVRQIQADSVKDDEATPLLTFFRTGPVMSRHKVGAISDAHRMMEAASNSLLKTLEEPHPHAKLILTTESIGSIRPTILSRCLAVACSAPSERDLTKHFPAAQPEDFEIGEGSPGKLTRVLRHPTAYREIHAFARRLPLRKPEEALSASDEFRSLAETLEKSRGIGARAGNAEALSVLATVLARGSLGPAQWPLQVIEAHRRILGNGNPGLVFDALFIGLLNTSR